MVYWIQPLFSRKARMSEKFSAVSMASISRFHSVELGTRLPMFGIGMTSRMKSDELRMFPSPSTSAKSQITRPATARHWSASVMIYFPLPSAWIGTPDPVPSSTTAVPSGFSHRKA